MIKILIITSFLLFSTHSAFLALLLSLFSSHLRRLFQLLNELLLFNFTVEEMFAPLVVDLLLAELAGLFLHHLLLLARLLFEEQVLQAHVLFVHQLALSPLAESVFIVLPFVSLEVVLNLPDLVQVEFVEAELKVYQVSVHLGSHDPPLAAAIVHLAVRKVQAQECLVLLHAFDKGEQLGDNCSLCLGVEWSVLVLINVVTLDIKDSQSCVLLKGRAKGLDRFGP